MSPYGAMGGSECGNRIGGANYGCVLFSSWDMTTGRTTNWRRRPNADKQPISHICPLSPHHSAGQDSTQLNSTQLAVELSWVELSFKKWPHRVGRCDHSGHTANIQNRRTCDNWTSWVEMSRGLWSQRLIVLNQLSWVELSPVRRCDQGFKAGQQKRRLCV